MAHDGSLATAPGDCNLLPIATLELRSAGRVGVYSAQAPASNQGQLVLCVVESGSAEYELGEHSLNVGSRSIFFLFPEQSCVLARAAADYRVWMASFEPELIARTCAAPGYDVLRQRDASRTFHRHLGKASAKRLLLQLEALAMPGLHALHFNAGLAYLLLSAWAEYQKAADSRHAASLHPAVEKAARILRAEPATGSLDELARTCGASASWLSRLFRQQMSVSLVDYRNHCRIERFFELFRGGQHRNICDAAFEAGFGSYAQFHRVFRKKLGYGPAELRRRSSQPAASELHYA